MSILGVVVRVKPGHLTEVVDHLSSLPGVDVALNPGDGRLVVVIEDTQDTPAAQTMATLALHVHVLNTSLVYEYSGPDIEHATQSDPDMRFQSWRTTLTQMAQGQNAAQTAPARP
jgi:periplasmic nitrate reductase NapD